MPKHSPLLIATVLCACSALALAQEASPPENSAATAPTAEVKKPTASAPVRKSAAKPTPKPEEATDGAPAPEVSPEPTPKPKKLNFFQRLFGSRKRKPQPTPTPESTPTPTPRRTGSKPSATPAPTKSTPSPKLKKSASDTTSEMPVLATPTATKKTASPGATPAPKPVKAAASTTTKPAKPLNEPPADADPEVKEKFRFDQARAKAAEDPQIKSLKKKADEASTDEESKKALRAYNKALFDKIRKIDSSVSDRATRLEAAILKRLNE